MRRYSMLWLLCGALLTAVGESDARPLLVDETAIAAPRFAGGDLDGDGRVELVIGGRVGPFRPTTDPLAAKSARVEIYADGGGWKELLARSDDLHMVEDVASGDFDGDGIDEIAAVGGRSLYLLGLVDGGLEVERMEELGRGRLRRVEAVDLDGDGRSELVIVDSRRGRSEEVPESEVRFLRMEDGWREIERMPVDGHVGDICVVDTDGDRSPELILEQGAEEMGGLLRVFSLEGGSPFERFEQQVTSERRRALSLAGMRQDGRSLLAIGGLDGGIGVWEFQGNHLAKVTESPTPVGMLRGLYLDVSGDGIQVISGITPPGSLHGQLWRVDDAMIGLSSH